MKTYMLEPQAPLVFRNGRPFGAGYRDEAEFPWPSSTAGAVRTTLIDQQSELKIDSALKQGVHGPFLAIRNIGAASVSQLTPMMPKPADAVPLLDTSNLVKCFRLVPDKFEDGTGADMPLDLAPLVLKDCSVKGKPQTSPKFWPWEHMMKWMCGEDISAEEIANEVTTPVHATRTHVAIDKSTYAAKDAALFQTDGWDCAPQRNPDGLGWKEKEHVFLVRTANAEQELKDDWVCWGGERRLSKITSIPNDVLALSEECKKKIVDGVKEKKCLKMTLVTPAIFSNGWYPGWINAETKLGTRPNNKNLTLKLVAAAIERWQGISGWDLVNKQPKASRKAVAAGATYWFEIEGDFDQTLLEAIWLAPVSDTEQDQLDGFGLAIWGIGIK